MNINKIDKNLNYSVFFKIAKSILMEQLVRFELTIDAWQASVLPLHYSCNWRSLKDLNLGPTV